MRLGHKGAGTQQDWDTIALGHTATGTQWAVTQCGWDTMRLGNNRTGTQQGWDTMGLGQCLFSYNMHMKQSNVQVSRRLS